jgi:replicative DNA helicase
VATERYKSIQSNEALLIAEKRVLNAVFNSPELLDRLEIAPEMMPHSICRSILKSMERMREQKAVCTRDSLLQWASDVDINIDDKTIDAITGAKILQHENELNDAIMAITEGNKRLNTLKKLNEAARVIDSMPISEDASEAKQLIDEAGTSLSAFDDDVKRMYDMDGWFKKYDEDRTKRRNGKQYPFNNFIFDSLLVDGASPGTFGCLCAASGMGKSTIGLSLMNSLIELDQPVIMFSLEMALTPTMDRLLAKRLQMEYSSLVNPGEDYDMQQSAIDNERAELLNKKRFRICENADMSLADIRKHIMKFQSDIGQKYCIVIIDLLSMVTDFMEKRGGANFSQVAEVGVNKLSALCKELSVHVLGLVQLNRQNESEKASTIADLKKFKPTRTQVKNANAYLERGRYLIGAYREKFWAEQYLTPEEHEDMEDIITVTTLKQSNGALKSINALYDGSHFDIIPIENSVVGASP